MQLAPNPIRTLADSTSAALMLPKFQGRSMPDVMRELSQALHQENDSMPDTLYPALKALNCELLTSTMLNLGAAFPHVSTASLCRPRFALGRSGEPLSWRAPAFRPTDLVFLILDSSPADVESRQLVSTLQLLGNYHLRLDALRQAATAEEMLAVLTQVPLVPVSGLPPLPLITTAPHQPAFHFRRWRR
jgi:mannitol/fructose-specific phosphotransferase system IIA component (Ntr-type)